MFQQIIYINLEHRIDRLENVLKQISKINKNNNAIKINAIDGKTLNINNMSQSLVTQNGINDAINNNLSVGIPLTKGAIGCALSHREAYIKIINNNINAALIVEDDITIDEGIYKKLIDEIYNDIPNDYDIIYLGYHNATIKYIYEKINNVFFRANIVYGLFGYIVTNNGAKKLLDIFPISKQIDTEISLHFDTIKGYIVSPEKRIIFSDESDKNLKFGTDIQLRELYKNNRINDTYHINIINKNLNNDKKNVILLRCKILFYILLILLIILKFNGSFKKFCNKIIPI